MRDRVSLLILTFPPLVLGIVVGMVLIAAQTLVVYPERRVAPQGKVLVPAGLPEGTEGRVRERVVTSMHVLLRAARDREGIVSAVEW